MAVAPTRLATTDDASTPVTAQLNDHEMSDPFGRIQNHEDFQWRAAE